jgi:hypothetical protein
MASKHTSTSSKRIGSAWLSPFEQREEAAGAPVPSARASNKGCLPMRFEEYRALLDWTARQLRRDDGDEAPRPPAPIPVGLNVKGEGWLRLVRDFSRLFRRAAGAPNSLREHNIKWHRRRMTGISHSRAIFHLTRLGLACHPHPARLLSAANRRSLARSHRILPIHNSLHHANGGQSELAHIASPSHASAPPDVFVSLTCCVAPFSVLYCAVSPRTGDRAVDRHCW